MNNSDIFNKKLHEKLEKLKNKNIPYVVCVGDYDYEDFNVDRHIDNINEGFDFVDYLKKYRDQFDSNIVCQLQVKIDIDKVGESVINEFGHSINYIEYNGYELSYGKFY